MNMDLDTGHGHGHRIFASHQLRNRLVEPISLLFPAKQPCGPTMSVIYGAAS
jgi:hypothetical protein